MPTRPFVVRTLAAALMLIVMMLAATVFTASAQDRAETKAWVEEYLRYFKSELKFTPQEVDRLVELRVKLHAPATTLEDRQAALKEVAVMLFRASGTDPQPPEQFFTNFSRNQGAVIHRIITDASAKPINKANTPLGQLGPVEKRGRGPVSMILLADVRADWTIWQSFMDRNAERYMMYAVTLPGYGGTPAPPRPATLDLTKTPWWDGAEQGVLKLIETNRLSKPVVVGMPGSSYLAARLALHHPDKVRAAVLMDGAVYAPFRSIANPDRPATLAERPQVMMRQPGSIGMLQEMFLPMLLTSREAAEARVKALPLPQITANLRNIDRAREIVTNATAGSDPRAYRYNVEFFSSDLSAELKNLKTPLLVLPALHDDNSPGQGGQTPSQWYEVKMKEPALPITITPFENTRSYISEEAPKEFDQAIESFLGGKPVSGKRSKEIALRPSPRGESVQQIGATRVAITYGRPQVNKRPIWGQLVPYNRLWRTGANEATYISFDTDVLIEGQKLAAGSYALFTIPTETEWTIIFNRVPNLWGQFYYNPEFDALKVKTKPQPAEHQEWLSYSFELLSPSATNVIIHWEKVKAAFKIEPEPAKAASSGN